MAACEECSWPEVTGLSLYHWLELCSRWCLQQNIHFDTGCQRPKGKLHFSIGDHDEHLIWVCSTLFPPSAGDEYKNHPSLHGCIALPIPEVPKMSVGAICFTSSGSNGSCWVVLVPPRPPFFFEKSGFLLYATCAEKKRSLRALHPKTVPKKTRFTPPPQKASYANFHNRATLSSQTRPPRRQIGYLSFKDGLDPKIARKRWSEDPNRTRLLPIYARDVYVPPPPLYELRQSSKLIRSLCLL